MTQKEGTKRFQILDGSMLKLIAVVTMLIDHTAVFLMQNNTTVLLRVSGYTLTLYTLMRTIGRISFPIYAFLLAEGYLHTRDVRQYSLNLLLFAILSEIPWNLEHTGTYLYPSSQNVFFTLFLGLAGIWVMDRFRDDIRRQAPLLLGLLLMTFLIKSDYGCRGFAFILLMYLLRDSRLHRAVVGSCILSSTWKAGLAFIPISLYNGKRGFVKGDLLKYFFYAVYPLHMLVIYYIRYRM
ncbi:MAG: TraX protein [Eubacteriaceae bacterium]|nr:TraX protein [Eubacteriaceae bacterium]